MSNLVNALKNRRSVYHLGKNSQVSEDQIVDRIREVAKEVPTAFNSQTSQTSRTVVLFGDKHQQLWDHIYEVQEDVLEGDMWDYVSGTLKAARQGMGTVLFFEDLDEVKKMPTNEDRQNAYKENNNANHQYATWLALAELGLGANLQHYNVGHDQGYDRGVRELLDLPESYAMLAQMPFGSVETPAADKEYIDTDVQVQVFK